MDTADPVDMIVTVGGAFVLLCVGILVWQARKDIAAVVRTIFGRYADFRWYGPTDDEDILSSDEKDEEKTPDTVPVPVLVSPDPVPVVPLSERDIIKWLALAKVEESAYRFTANKIYELVGGRRNEVMRAIADYRKETTSTEPAPERIIVVRDHEGRREIPI